MKRFIIAFLLTAVVTGAVVYTFMTGPQQHTENRLGQIDGRQ